MLGHNRRMSGAECLADMLKGYGVTHVFHVPAVLRNLLLGGYIRTAAPQQSEALDYFFASDAPATEPSPQAMERAVPFFGGR